MVKKSREVAPQATIKQAAARDAARGDWLGKRIILSKWYSGYPEGTELCVTDLILTGSGKRHRLVLEGGKSVLADKLGSLFTLAGSSSSGGLGSVNLPQRDPSKQKKCEAIFRVFRSLQPPNGILGIEVLLKELRPHLPSFDTNDYLSLKASGVLDFSIGCSSCWLKQEAEHVDKPREGLSPLVPTESSDIGSRSGMEVQSLIQSLPGQTGQEATPKEKLPMELKTAQRRCWEWLKGLDGQTGALLRYWEALLTEFDGDLVQVAAARCPRDLASGILDTVDADFFEALGVQSVEHKILFARGMANL